MGNSKETFKILEPSDESGRVVVNISQRFRASFTGSEIIVGKTDQHGELVLKFSRRKDGALREWKGLTNAFNHGVPTTPPIFLVQNDEDHIGVGTQKVNGESLANCADAKSINNLGTIIDTMHHMVPVEGQEWQSDGRRTFRYYDTSMERWQQSNEDVLSPQGNAYVLLQKFYESTRSSHSQTRPAFVHYDLHDDQVLKSDDHLTILDFEEWKESHPLNDPAIYLFHSLRMKRPTENFVAFLEGYTNGKCLTDNEKSVLAFHLLYYGMRGVETYSQLWPKYLDYSKRYLARSVDFINKETIWKT